MFNNSMSFSTTRQRIEHEQQNQFSVDVIKPLRCYAVRHSPYAARLTPYATSGGVKLTHVITMLDGFLRL